MRDLLQRLDDPNHWEHPADFDRDAEIRAFEDFVTELWAILNLDFPTETGTLIQDASFHSEASLPGGLLRFSNFGRMIAFAPDNEVSDKVVASVRELAVRHAYVLMSTTELETPYMRAEGNRFGIDTWWIRYFDYL
jgi:hypothetical protein